MPEAARARGHLWRAWADFTACELDSCGMGIFDQPSEYGGKPQRNTIQPPKTPRGHKGHTELTNDELLKLTYLTGQTVDTTRDPDNGEAFSGMLPLEEAKKINPEPEKFPLE